RPPQSGRSPAATRPTASAGGASASPSWTSPATASTSPTATTRAPRRTARRSPDIRRDRSLRRGGGQPNREAANKGGGSSARAGVRAHIMEQRRSTPKAGTALLERAAERDALAAHARAVRTDKRGRLVLVSGEAGIGKTSLLRTFVADHADLRLLAGACD